MTTQYDLFGLEAVPRTDPDQPAIFRAVARLDDPETSWAAAASITNITQTHSRILTVLGDLGIGTDEDISRHYGIFASRFQWPPVSPSGLRSRRAELVEIGRIKDSGERGLTASGRKSIKWITA